MKHTLVAAILIALVSNLVLSQEYPVMAFKIYSLSSVENPPAHSTQLQKTFPLMQGAHFNYGKPFTHWSTEGQILELLDSAEVHGIKIILPAVVDSYSAPERHYYDANETYFWTVNGDQDSDEEVEHPSGMYDGDAMKAIEPNVYMVSVAKDRVFRNYDQWHTATFRMRRATSPSLPAGTPIAQVEVWNYTSNSLIVSDQITFGEFPSNGTYGIWSYSFFASRAGSNPWSQEYDFRVKWLRGVDIWLDNIRVDGNTLSVVASTLFSGGYDSAIKTKAKVFNNHPAFSRFYLTDEPLHTQYLSYNYVNQLLRVAAQENSVDPSDGTGLGYTAKNESFGNSYPDPYDRFVKEAQPYELAADVYRFSKWSPQPYDAGYTAYAQDTLQRSVERFISAQNSSAWSASGTWQYFPNISRFPGATREPHISEVAAQVNLALAYGARGIHYFHYWTREDGSSEFPIGLVDLSLDPINSGSTYSLYGEENGENKWNDIAAINARLAGVLGSTLMTVPWKGAKSWTDSPSQTEDWSSIVSSVSTKSSGGVADGTAYVETGHFREETGPDYLLTVNRRTIPGRWVWNEIVQEYVWEEGEIRDITMTLNKGGGTYEITDLESGDIWIVNGSSGQFTIRLNPGDAALLKIAPHSTWNSKSFQGTETVTITPNATLSIPTGADIENVFRLIVQSGGALSVGSDATLTFTSAVDVMAETSTKGAIYVDGKINVDGATFAPNNANLYWLGVFVNNSNPSSGYNYVVNSEFSRCKYALALNNSRFVGYGDEISGNTFRLTALPIRLTFGSNVQEISENILEDNVYDGISVYSSTLSRAEGNIIRKNTLNNSGRAGFWIYGAGVTPLLTGNSISYSTEDGIRSEYYAVPNLGGPDGSSGTPGNNTITNNGRYGVYALSSSQPFLGDYDYAEECAIYGGYNDIHSNSNKQLYVTYYGVNAEWNYWGANPNDPYDPWNFTYNTCLTLFGNTYPKIRPAQFAGGMAPLSGGGDNILAEAFTSSSEIPMSVEETVPEEMVLLVLGDQLAMSQKYEYAIEVYDSLIVNYPETEEAEVALLRTYNAMLKYNEKVTKEETQEALFDLLIYFDGICATNKGKRLEKPALELAAAGALVQGEHKASISRYLGVISGWPGTESDMSAKSALFDLYMRTESRTDASKVLADLNGQFPEDPVTEVVNSVARMSGVAVSSTSSTAPVSSLRLSKQAPSKAVEKDLEKTDEEEAKDIQLSVYPNPFNPATNISYTLSGPAHVELAVYDLLGRRIALLVREEQEPGQKLVTFDGSQQPSGIYYVTLTAGAVRKTGRLLLVK